MQNAKRKTQNAKRKRETQNAIQKRKTRIGKNARLGL
jgi:hypothetical protein